MLPEAQRCAQRCDLGAPGATGTAEGPGSRAVPGELWLSTVRLEQCPEAEPGAQPQPSCGPKVAAGSASPALLPVLCTGATSYSYLCVEKYPRGTLSKKKCLQN